MAKTIRSAGHDALRQALIHARLEAGLTQAQLAARLRCHQSLVARIEIGERRVDVIELVVLARAIGVPTGDLVQEAEAAIEPDHRI